jgi:hypothetical protein
VTTTKELRYYVMLALYFPILLYSVSTFEVDEDAYAVKQYRGVAVGAPSVVVGQRFSARAFLTAERLTTAQAQAPDGIQPTLVANPPLTAQGDSLLVLPTDTLLAPDDDRTRVSYSAYFEAPRLSGTAHRVPLSGSVTVRRPEIVARTETARALYRHTRNRVRLSVPGLPKRALRVVGPAGNADGTTLSLSPTGPRTRIRVFLKRPDTTDLLLGTRTFPVINPPRPEIRVRSAQGPIASGAPLPLRRAVLHFQVEPDRAFLRRHPQDAQYVVNRATVYLRRGDMASESLGTFSLDDGRLVLTDALRTAQAGDQIVVRLQGIARLTHRGQRVEVALRETSRTFGFVLS